MARIGYVAKGLVYFLIGLFAFLAAIGLGGSTSGTEQIFEHFLHQPYGFILLSMVMLGFIAHAVWCLIKGISDPENRGKNTRSIFYRILDVLTGLLYLSFAYGAIQILLGHVVRNSNQKTEIWVARILLQPFGRWIILMVALIVMIVGFYQFYASYKAYFGYDFDASLMNEKEQNIVRQFGRIGFVAWGVVYCMIAFLLFEAAIHFDASRAGGMGDALKTLAHQPYGLWFLGITSAGLITYGLYLFILAYFHNIGAD